MPTAELMICVIAGALAAAVLMNWGVRKSRQYRREGRLIAQALTGMPVFLMLGGLAAALGAVEWNRSHDLAEEAAGAVVAGIMAGAVTASPGGLGFGGDDDGPDDFADGDDGGDDGGDGGGE